MLRSLLITSGEELADHEDRWEVLRQESGGTVFASNYMTRAWFDAYGHLAEPRVILVEDDGDLVGIAPLASYRYQMARLPIKVLALAGEMKGRLRLSTTSLMYPPERKDVLDRIMEEIRKLDWSLLTTINLRINQANTMYVDAVKGAWQSEEYSSGRMMTIRLPKEGSLAETLDTKTRKNLRYRANLLEREGHEVHYRRASLEDLDAAVNLYAKQHIERWASKGGSYFRDSDNVRFLKMSTAAVYRAGHGNLTELLIDGKVAAQDFDILDGSTCYADKTGMSAEFMRYSPGWMVTIYAMDRMRDQGAERCIMGIGGEDYKHEMGGVEEPLMGIRATRGMISILDRVSSSPTVQRISSRMGYTMESVEVNVPRH